MDLLRSSNIEIHKVCCSEFLTSTPYVSFHSHWVTHTKICRPPIVAQALIPESSGWLCFRRYPRTGVCYALFALFEVELACLTVSLIKASVLGSQPSPPAAHWQDPGPSGFRASNSPLPSSPAIPDCSPLPPIPGDISKRKGFSTQVCAKDPLQDLRDSAQLGRVGSTTE
jgi:hypothetical protein